MNDHRVINRLVKAAFVAVFVFLVTACSTHFRQGLHHLEANNYPEALIFFESDAKRGRRASALHVANLYLLNYQVPRDLAKSRAYLNIALAANYGRYDQAYDYFIPLIKAYQILADTEQTDKSLAINILRYQKYQSYHWPLAMLAYTHLIGFGVERDLVAAKSYFEQSIDKALDDGTSIFYAWWLVTFPDEAFRDPKKALALVEDLTLEDYAEKPLFLDAIAAVYAANGLFDLAINTQRRAVSWLMLRSVRHGQLRDYEASFKARLESYQQSKAWYFSEDVVQACMTHGLPCMKPLLSLMPDENMMFELQLHESYTKQQPLPQPKLETQDLR